MSLLLGFACIEAYFGRAGMAELLSRSSGMRNRPEGYLALRAPISRVL